MYALITTASPQSVVAVYPAIPNPLPLPNGETVGGIGSAPWTSNDGVYSLVSVTPFTVPNGQEISSATPSYAVSNGVVTQTYPTQAIPASVTAGQTYEAAINAGVTLTWSSSTTLNGTYAIDPTTVAKLVGLWLAVVELGTFSNGTALQPWQTSAGVAVSMSLPQFKAFVAALLKYIAQLDAANVSEAGGGNPTWPSSSVSVTG